MIFVYFFFVRKTMLILRFPHSFWVWECWGHSNAIDFAIFQAEIKDFRWTRIEPNPLILVSPRLEKQQNRLFWSVPSTRKPQNYAANEVLALSFPPRKKIFFAKIIFSQYFWDFSTRQNPKIRDLADPGMCPYLATSDVSPRYRLQYEINRINELTVTRPIEKTDIFSA